MPDGTTNGRHNGTDEPEVPSSQTAGTEAPPILTTRQGHPVYNNQNNRTVGDRGPTTLENYHFLE